MIRRKTRLIIGAAIVLVVLAFAGCTIIYNASSNAYLSNLVPSQGTLAFSATTGAYGISLGNAAGGMTLTPTAADSGATITVNGVSVTSGIASAYTPLNVGDTVFTVVVTAEDRVSTYTYTVTVTASIMLDEFTRTDTTGRDLGPDWTVSGSGADEINISSGWVYSRYLDTSNTKGVYAVYNGAVDYSGSLYASTDINLDSGSPSLVGGIMINGDTATWSGYFCEINWNGVASYQLYLAEWDGASAVHSAASNFAFTAGTTYILEIYATGTAFTAKIKNSSGVEITSVSFTDSPRTYADGKVIFYNYVADSLPTGNPLYMDNFYIQKY